MKTIILRGLMGGLAAVALAGCSGEKTTASSGAAPSQDGMAGAANPAPANPNAPIVDGAATLVAPATIGEGATVTVKWTGPANAGDYIDLVPRGYASTDGEISYAYVRDSNGSVEVRVPTKAGDYDLRYVLQQKDERQVKVVVPLVVSSAAATLTSPASAETGQGFSVAWTGPDGNGDYLDIVKAGETATSGEIVYVYTNAGTPAKLEAPSAAGDYVVRYLMEGAGGRKVIATAPLAVTLAKATLKAPASVAKGADFKVEWTGPKSSGDYVDLMEKGSTATSGEKSYFFLDDSPTLKAPEEAGEYEVRYVLEAPGGRAVLARIPVSVR